MRYLSADTRQEGFTIVELMIAMLISLILMAGVLQIYLSSKRSYNVTSSQARMQENGRFAMHFLTNDIRMAGYSGCSGSSNVTPNVISKTLPASSSFAINVGIEGYDNDGTSSWPADFPSQPANLVANTSVLRIQFGSTQSAYLTGNMTVTNANIQVNSNSGSWTAGDYILITDCSHADLFTATNVSQSSGKTTIAHGSNANTQNFLTTTYNTNAQIMSFSDEIYYIGTNASGRPALYNENASNVSTELIDNVQSMKLLYGVTSSSSTSAQLWLTAAQVTAANDWPNVVAVRINLLMTTPDNYLTPTPQSIPFNGTTYTATDRRLYWTFGDTVAIRNRVQ